MDLWHCHVADMDFAIKKELSGRHRQPFSEWISVL